MTQQLPTLNKIPFTTGVFFRYKMHQNHFQFRLWLCPGGLDHAKGAMMLPRPPSHLEGGILPPLPFLLPLNEFLFLNSLTTVERKLFDIICSMSVCSCKSTVSAKVVKH